MDYRELKKLQQFLECESINAKNTTNLPSEFKPILYKLCKNGYKSNITGRVMPLNDHTKLIAIRNATFGIYGEVNTCFISTDFEQGVFVFTDDYDLRLHPRIDVNEIIQNCKDKKPKSAWDLDIYLQHWMNLILKILEKCYGITYNNMVPGGTVLERQYALLPAILLTHINVRIRAYLESLNNEELFNSFSVILHLFFPKASILTNEDEKYYINILYKIIHNDNPIVNCL